MTSYENLLVEYKPRPIAGERQYQKVLRQVDGLMRWRKLTRAEDDLLQLLGSLVAQYDNEQYLSPDVPPGRVLEHPIDPRGLTKARVARDTGIPRQTITNIIKGSRGASGPNRLKLARCFGVSPEVFVPVS